MRKTICSLNDWCKENNREDILAAWDTFKNEQEGHTIYNTSRGTGLFKAHWKCAIAARAKYHHLGCPNCKKKSS